MKWLYVERCPAPSEKLQLIPAPLSRASAQRHVFGNGVCVAMCDHTSL